MHAAVRKEILAHRDAHHPSVVAQAERHAASVQLRVADAITGFAGSMKFVYAHAILFGGWMLVNVLGFLVFDDYPFQLLTLIVSLEAIFLSTFVMIGQNKQAVFQQHKADQDFEDQRVKLDELHTLVSELHSQLCQPKS